ncbi:hypothetical protein J6590_022898 [Homalodisca vitripennis]|nr:hypothetical protein J6590_022898 [Homalodisca vitripennis]
MPSSWSIHHTLVSRDVSGQQSRLRLVAQTGSWDTPSYTHTRHQAIRMPSSWSIHHTLVSRAVSGQQSRLRLVAQTGSWDTPSYTHNGNQAIGDAFILVDPSHSSFTCCLWAAITPTPRSSDWLLGYAAISDAFILVDLSHSSFTCCLWAAITPTPRSSDWLLGYAVIHTHGNQAISDAFILVDLSHSSFTCCLWAAITPTPRSSDWLLGYAVIHTHGNQAISDAFILVDLSHSSFTCCLWAAITPTPHSLAPLTWWFIAVRQVLAAIAKSIALTVNVFHITSPVVYSVQCSVLSVVQWCVHVADVRPCFVRMREQMCVLPWIPLTQEPRTRRIRSPVVLWTLRTKIKVCGLSTCQECTSLHGLIISFILYRPAACVTTNKVFGLLGTFQECTSLHGLLISFILYWPAACVTTNKLGGVNLRVRYVSYSALFKEVHYSTVFSALLAWLSISSAFLLRGPAKSIFCVFFAILRRQPRMIHDCDCRRNMKRCCAQHLPLEVLFTSTAFNFSILNASIGKQSKPNYEYLLISPGIELVTYQSESQPSPICCGEGLFVNYENRRKFVHAEVRDKEESAQDILENIYNLSECQAAFKQPGRWKGVEL